MKNIITLREHLFQAIERLANADQDELGHEIDKACSIVTVAETIIKSAETEVKFISITNSEGSGFLLDDGRPELPKPADRKRLPKPKREEPADDEFNVDQQENWIA